MSDILSWPWPRILVSSYKCFLVSGSPGGNLTLSEVFYSSAGYWGALPVLDLGPYTDVREISIADFGPFYVVCTLGYNSLSQPIRKVFVRDLGVALGFAFASFTVQNNPLCGVCTNFNGQFIGANIEAALGSSWYGLSSRSIVWSAIGTYELDPQVNVEAGYLDSIGQWPARQNVHVVALRQLGSDLLCYTDSGTIMLNPNYVGGIFTHGHRRHINRIEQLGVQLSGMAVLSGNHVAGDERLHGFVDTHGEFWTVALGGQLTRRGYREYLRSILDYTSANDTRTIVSYIPHEQTFYVSNGNECLVINRYGAYKTHQMVASSIQVQDGSIAGTFITGTDTEARMTCDALDFGSRGVKSIEALLVDASHPTSATMTLSVDWRQNKSSDFISRPWITGGPVGRAVVRTAAIEFRPRVRFSSFTGTELTSILANIKYSDQRFKRGTIPAQHEVGLA